MEFIEEFDELFEDGEGIVLSGDGVHIGSTDLFVPFLLGHLYNRVLYHSD